MQRSLQPPSFCLAQINPVVGDLLGNAAKILDCIARASGQADIVVFPELALTGYPPQDLLLSSSFLDEVERVFADLLVHLEGVSALIGLPRREQGRLYNSAAVISNGHLLGYHDKILFPDYDVFNESRYFISGGSVALWDLCGQKVAITICEDIWHKRTHDRDPVSEYKPLHPTCMINLSASPYTPHKHEQRLAVCQRASQILACPVYLCNQVGGNDGIIFDGASLCVSAEGVLEYRGAFCQEELLFTKNPASVKVLKEYEGIYNALVIGIRDYFAKTGFERACLGLSGGIDSAVVLCLLAEALGPAHVTALLMPSRYSSEGSITDSIALVDRLCVSYRIQSIEPLFEAYLQVINPQKVSVQENIQARIRGNLLMAFSNETDALLINTGNKSELAMGYVTLYGDLCGSLSPVGDLTKTRVYGLARWINRNGEVIPQAILEKPPSAELAHNQKDSDSLPDYAILDCIIQEGIEKGLSAQEIAKNHQIELSFVSSILQQINRNEYKRRQAPPALRISEHAFTVGRRVPIAKHM